MTEMAGAEVRCECGKVLALRDLTPARLLVTNTLHKQSIQLTPIRMSIRGRCSGCSKLHTLTYEIPHNSKRRRIVLADAQLSLF